MASKECCELMSNWEASDNKKVSNVLHIEKIADDLLSGSGDCCVDRQLSNDPIITGTCSVPPTPLIDGPSLHLDKEFCFSPIQLKPFLHPEMTKASQCELRLLISPRHHLRIVKLVVISVARCIEVYDRLGEYLMTIKGDKLTKQSTNLDSAAPSSTNQTTTSTRDSSVPQKVTSSSSNGTVQPQESSKSSGHRWFRCVYVPGHDTFEVIIRITGSPEPSVLHLRYLGLYVGNHDWNEINILSNSLSGSALSSPLINVDRLQEILAVSSGHSGEMGGVGIGQRLYSSHANQVLAGLIAASQSNSSATGNTRSNSPNVPSDSPLLGSTPRQIVDFTQLRNWLDSRLTSIENNVTQKLETLSARLDSLEANIQSKNKAQNDP